MSLRRVVVTGRSVVTALGCDVSDVWTRVCNGISGICALEDATVSGGGRVGGHIRDFDLSSQVRVEGRLVRRMDRFVQFAMAAAQSAINESRIDVAACDAGRCGVIIGSGIGGLKTIDEQHHRLHARGPERVSALMVPSLMINAAAANVAVHWGLKGPCSGVAAVCASGTQAIGMAYRMIQSGVVDMMICGGAEAPLTPGGVSGFAAAGCLCSGNRPPQYSSRPFDRDRDGCVLAEGAGLLLLEDSESARRRRAVMLAEITGYGESYGPSAIGEDSRGEDGSDTHAMVLAMQTALADAECTPEAIDYLNAGAAGTTVGDRSEATAIREVFDSEHEQVAVSSTKGQLGHLLGASGGVESVFCVSAIRTHTVPPTANLDVTAAGCDLNHVTGAAHALPVRYAMNNSFSFTGHNACLVFKEFTDQEKAATD